MSIPSKILSLIRLLRQKKIVPIVTPIHEDSALNNQVALVAGGSGGIGLAIAKKLIECGCRVVLSGSNKKHLETAISQLPKDMAAFVVIDYHQPESFPQKVSEVCSIFGRIDLLISSAGVHTENLTFENMSIQEFDRVLGVNIRGVYFMAQAISRYMISESIRGNILFISSSRGSEPAWSPYGLSKWALNGFTKGLAQELVPYGITVNSIAPGPTATPLIGIKSGDGIETTQTKIGRLTVPEEIAELALFMVSKSGFMMSGETIHISGGRGVWDIR